MLKVWGLAQCDRTRAALADLRAAGFQPELTDIRAPGLDDVARDSAVQAAGAGLVNKSSTTWRALSPEDQALPVADLVARHPTVIKRPLILHDDAWSTGWTPAVRARFGL